MEHRHLTHQQLTLTAMDDIISRGMRSDWERVLSAAARLQRFIPHAVLVGGTASAVYAKHRFSRDADHIFNDLRDRFDTVLADLEPR